eukprot:2512901-Pleurochrysis_carterae.AAC.1
MRPNPRRQGGRRWQSGSAGKEGMSHGGERGGVRVRRRGGQRVCIAQGVRNGGESRGGARVDLDATRQGKE